MEFGNFNPNIKFTYEFSEENISFLDIFVKPSNDKLQNSFYVKPTDPHYYLTFQPNPQTLRHALRKIARTTSTY